MDLRNDESIRQDWKGFEPYDKYVRVAATHSPLSTFQKVLKASGSLETALRYQALAELRLERGESLFQEIANPKLIS